MAATTDAQCKACNSTWYLSKGTNCCPPGYEWYAATGMCISHEPCYATSLPSYCNSMAPNSPYPISTWWDNPFFPDSVGTVIIFIQVACFAQAIYISLSKFVAITVSPTARDCATRVIAIRIDCGPRRDD